MRDFGSKQSTTWSRYQQAAAGPTPGKQTLTEMLPPANAPVQRKAAVSAPAPAPAVPSEPPTIHDLFGARVQRKATAAEPDTEQIHASAQRGVATSASALPHAETIQRAFGRHGISGIQAHTGAEASASTGAMGAQAYATGDHVVLGDGADLFTVAHEAAHVVQQRGGVQCPGGVGKPGDAHERHADAVAQRVVEGRSAEALLDQRAPDGPPRAAPGAVQRRLTGEPAPARIERRLETLSALAEIRRSGWLDPSSVEVLIFSGRQGRIAQLPALRTNQRPAGELPATDMAYLRERGGKPHVAEDKSRDGEMFKLVEIRREIARFSAGFDNQEPDELRIEVLGPRGTCSDCELTLRETAKVWQRVLDADHGKDRLRLSVVARWTDDVQVEHPERRGARRSRRPAPAGAGAVGGSARRTYGSPQATQSAGTMFGSWGVPHWKNRIQVGAPFPTGPFGSFAPGAPQGAAEVDAGWARWSAKHGLGPPAEEVHDDEPGKGKEKEKEPGYERRKAQARARAAAEATNGTEKETENETEKEKEREHTWEKGPPIAHAPGPEQATPPADVRPWTPDPGFTFGAFAARHGAPGQDPKLAPDAHDAPPPEGAEPDLERPRDTGA